MHSFAKRITETDIQKHIKCSQKIRNMPNTASNSILPLKRVLNLAEVTPLILCIDSMAQSSKWFLEEIIYCLKSGTHAFSVIFISFETAARPYYATHFLDGNSKTLKSIHETVTALLPADKDSNSAEMKYLVMIDTLNSIDVESLTTFLSSISSPHATILGVYHNDVRNNFPRNTEYYPDALSLLKFVATKTVTVTPYYYRNETHNEELDNAMSTFAIPKRLNDSVYEITLQIHRRSGRPIEHRYLIDSKLHDYNSVSKEESTEPSTDDNPDMLQGLTTFNLATTSKQKESKNNVNLPFLEAQSFNTGGAIVYQYEKDDDYDEEDPYEDPF